MITYFKKGDYVKFYDLSSNMIDDYTKEDYDYFYNNILEIEFINKNKVKFFNNDKNFKLFNTWGDCTFEKDVHYTRKMKITKLLKNESI